MLNQWRGTLRPILDAVGAAFAATGLAPIVWTTLGLAFALLAALVYAGYATGDPVLGGVLLLVSGLLDVVDGQVARLTGRTSQQGAFLDSVFDKIGETAVLFGVLLGGLADPRLVFLAATTSLLVGYTRARAECLGIELQGIGVGERAERLLVLALGGMVGVMAEAVAVVVLIAAITVVQRLRVVWRTLAS